ncbi:hypothetical protein BDV37DRAFT_262608 [Aspergillus pseudonomiae]|uniref:Uncharacterized protein n=1 Tax=Aspergillus pseudonomiae TaxID=1506151 RepID=A0A5N7CYU5_9EURO|nr:uncharacterized protein BDV37DRAFT_262608 [Aspergillus pseudonomiae]KAE8398708.1 hypothetical protein BDV37DRAFT_262608 [Aspergillus pseudonomiae]
MYFSIMLTTEWADIWVCSEFWAWSDGLIIFHVVRLSVIINVRQDLNVLPPIPVELDHGHDWACLMLSESTPVPTAHQRTNWTFLASRMQHHKSDRVQSNQLTSTSRI